MRKTSMYVVAHRHRGERWNECHCGRSLRKAREIAKALRENITGCETRIQRWVRPTYPVVHGWRQWGAAPPHQDQFDDAYRDKEKA